jgi:hypothetical protein
VRELCSRFTSVSLIAHLILFLKAKTSKAAAEPPHSKKEAQLCSRALNDMNLAG